MAFDGKTTLPILDYSAYLAAPEGEERARLQDELAQQLRTACEDVGFYFVGGVESLVPTSLVKEMFRATAQFHDLDLDQKMNLIDQKGKGSVGYVPNMGDVENPDGAVRGAEGKTSNLRIVTNSSAFNESFLCAQGHGNDLTKNSYFPDDALPEMREVVKRYDAAMAVLVDAMVPVYEKALGLPAGELQRKFTEPLRAYRMTHYPETPVTQTGRMYGIFPHADQDFFTVLAQNEVPGLSVQLQDGAWMPVPALPGTFLINTGEILHRFTNGRWRNTMHRADNKSGTERYAVVNFVHQDRKAVLDPLVRPGEEQKWPSFTCVDFFREVMAPPKKSKDGFPGRPEEEGGYGSSKL